jgi:hypothetical protein
VRANKVADDESALVEMVALASVPVFVGHGSKGGFTGWIHDEVFPSILDSRRSGILGMIPEVEEEWLSLFFSWVGGMPKEERLHFGDASPERCLNDDSGVAAGKEAFPKLLEAGSNVRLLKTQGVDPKDGTQDEPQEYTWWVGGH